MTVGWAGRGESGARRGFAGMAADYVGPTPQATRLVALARVTRPGGRVACSLPWGPEVWTDLCRRHVDQVAEPQRAVARQRLAAAAVRPSAERVRQRLGLAAVATEVEAIVQRFPSPDEAWASLHRPGARVFLEALPASALSAFRDEFCARVATGDCAELRSEFLYWCFTTPG